MQTGRLFRAHAESTRASWFATDSSVYRLAFSQPSSRSVRRTILWNRFHFAVAHKYHCDSRRYVFLHVAVSGEVVGNELVFESFLASKPAMTILVLASPTFSSPSRPTRSLLHYISLLGICTVLLMSRRDQSTATWWHPIRKKRWP